MYILRRGHSMYKCRDAKLSLVVVPFKFNVMN